MNNKNVGTMEGLKKYTRFLRIKIKKMLIISIFFGLLTGGISQFVIPDYYYASVKWQTGMQAGVDFMHLLYGYSFLEKVIYEAGSELTPEELSAMMYLSIIGDSRVIELDIYDNDPEEAVQIIYAFLRVIDMEFRDIFDIKVVEEAGEVATLPKELPATIFRGMLLGFIITLFSITVRYIRGTRIKTIGDIENILQVPVLAIVPLEETITKKWKKEERKHANKRRIYAP